MESRTCGACRYVAVVVVCGEWLCVCAFGGKEGRKGTGGTHVYIGAQVRSITSIQALRTPSPLYIHTLPYLSIHTYIHTSIHLSLPERFSLQSKMKFSTILVSVATLMVSTALAAPSVSEANPGLMALVKKSCCGPIACRLGGCAVSS